MIGRRLLSSNTGSSSRLVFNAHENINKLLEQHDRSSYILGQYIPEPARNAFLAIRAFNIEIGKINNGGNNTNSIASKASMQLSSSLGVSTGDMKFKFWSDLISKIFADPYKDQNIGEPIGILLQDSLRNDINLDIDCFHRFLQTRRNFIKSGNFNTVDNICSYGEGTYSQLNYLTQGALLSPGVSPSSIKLLEYSSLLQQQVNDIAAHIGQATAICAMILGCQFYGSSRNQVTLPIHLMTKFDLSQESLLRLTQGHIKDSQEIESIKEKLKAIVYETAITANDHILSAKSKLSKSKLEIKNIVKANQQDKLIQSQFKKWRKNIPDAIYVPYMLAIPTQLYLERLQKYDFDIFHPKMLQKEWKLPWRSFKSFYQRNL
jgi:NADH dehydrogenase [ubiquinone] 1 alpha subcomplex assembly factor 6